MALWLKGLLWLVMAALGVAAVLALWFLFLARRRDDDEDDVE